MVFPDHTHLLFLWQITWFNKGMHFISLVFNFAVPFNIWFVKKENLSFLKTYLLVVL